MIRFLAVDPSLRSTGWATIENDQVTSGVLRPRRYVDGRWHDLKDPERMAWLAVQIAARVQHHSAQIVAIEGASYNSQSTVTDRIGGLHWIVRLTLWRRDIPYVIVPPASLKMWATNDGNASKDKMVTAAQTLCDYDGRSDDEADARLLHAMIADAMGLPYAEPSHSRRAEALAPIVTALSKIDLTGTDQLQEH